MDGIVMLRSTVVTLDSDSGNTFVTDCARYLEGLLSEDAIKAKYDIDETSWVGFADNGPLRQAVETEKNRRISNGEAARERAQQLFATAPNVLGTILHGDFSPRHKIDSARELRAIAVPGPEAMPASSRFQIRIDLTADSAGGEPKILHFDKSLTIDVNDVDPNDNSTDTNNTSTALKHVLPATTPTTNNSGGDDESI